MSSRRYVSMQERLLWNSIESDEYYYVDPKTGEKSYCWIWVAATNNDGYPRVCIRPKSGKRKGKPTMIFAHRESLRVFKGRRLTKRQKAMHLCNNPICINPEHLRCGSQKQNILQCSKDGRHGNQYRSPVRDMLETAMI